MTPFFVIVNTTLCMCYYYARLDSKNDARSLNSSLHAPWPSPGYTLKVTEAAPSTPSRPLVILSAACDEEASRKKGLSMKLEKAAKMAPRRADQRVVKEELFTKHRFCS